MCNSAEPVELSLAKHEAAEPLDIPQSAIDKLANFLERRVVLVEGRALSWTENRVQSRFDDLVADELSEQSARLARLALSDPDEALAILKQISREAIDMIATEDFEELAPEAIAWEGEL